MLAISLEDLETLTLTAILETLVTYFVIAAIVLLTAFFSPTNPSIPIIVSILLLIPIYFWQKNHRKQQKLSTEIEKDNRSMTFFWIFALFILALSIRIPSVLTFNQPYEKTPLIYLTILTIILIEKTDLSAFGFKTTNFVKSLLQGVGFYASIGGLTILTSYALIYVYTGKLVAQSYTIMPFLATMPFHTLCVGISEEGLFRGYMQTHIQKFGYLKIAILFQALLFGVWHFVWDLSPFNPWNMSIYVALTFLLGLVFGYFYSKVQNLVPLVLAHGLWNSFPQGIIASSEAMTALQELPASTQMMIGLLPYAISAIVTVLLLKLFFKAGAR